MTEQGRLSSTFDGWGDRLTYVAANGQLVVLSLAFTIGAVLVIYRPELPQVPDIVLGWLASLMLFFPPLVAFFVTFVRKLRESRMVEVHHINGVTDVREKYYVEPGVWEDRTVEEDAPSAYVLDGGGFEVREFEYVEDVNDLRIRGSQYSEMADSKLVTTKAKLEDIHGDLIDTFLAYNKLRGRISKMGLEIQGDLINEEAEADERGLMNPKTAVKDRFEEAADDAEENAPGDINDARNYAEEYFADHGIPEKSGPPQTQEQAAADD